MKNRSSWLRFFLPVDPAASHLPMDCAGTVFVGFATQPVTSGFDRTGRFSDAEPRSRHDFNFVSIRPIRWLWCISQPTYPGLLNLGKRARGLSSAAQGVRQRSAARESLCGPAQIPGACRGRFYPWLACAGAGKPPGCPSGEASPLGVGGADQWPRRLVAWVKARLMRRLRAFYMLLLVFGC